MSILTALIPYKAKILMVLGLAGILLITHASVYFVGRSDASKAQAKAEASVLKDELKNQTKEAAKNVTEAERVGREAAAMEEKLDRAIGELNEAIERAGALNCQLTPDELRALQALSDSYR